MKFLFTNLFICLLSCANAQESPPPPAMPDKANTQLVDSIIKITRHEEYFINYCTAKVNAFAAAHNWDKEKANRILKSIHFKYYNSTIYNSYASYSSEQLKALIGVLLSMNAQKKDWTTMILTNAMMQSNLDGFVNGLIEGKFIMPTD